MIVEWVVAEDAAAVAVEEPERNEQVGDVREAVVVVGDELKEVLERLVRQKVVAEVAHAVSRAAED